MGFAPDRSTPTSFKISSISTDRWGIPIWPSGGWRLITYCSAWPSPRRSSRAMSRPGLPTAPIFRARVERDSRRATAGAAVAGRVQAIRAGVLPYGHCGLGHGLSVGKARWTADAGVSGYRTSLPGAEYRADRRVAAASRDDWRISF